MERMIATFRMPRYREIPDVGLYLDQTVKYLNRFLAPLGCMTVTSSMISNYVKKRYIDPPVRKQYTADQIACLFFICITKSVLSMEHISRLFEIQRRTYTRQIAYDYFCGELEYGIARLFELPEPPKPCVSQMTEEWRILRSVVTTVAHIVYLSSELDALDQAPQPRALPAPEEARQA